MAIYVLHSVMCIQIVGTAIAIQETRPHVTDSGRLSFLYVHMYVRSYIYCNYFIVNCCNT